MRFGRHITLFCICGATLLFNFQNCAPNPGGTDDETAAAPSDKAISDADLKVIYSQIHTLATGNLECDSDTDCVAIPIGQKACGGPEKYEITATHGAPFAEITQLVQQLATATQEKLTENSNVVSTCSFVEAPPVSCVAHVCE